MFGSMVMPDSPSIALLRVIVSSDQQTTAALLIHIFNFYLAMSTNNHNKTHKQQQQLRSTSPRSLVDSICSSPDDQLSRSGGGGEDRDGSDVFTPDLLINASELQKLSEKDQAFMLQQRVLALQQLTQTKKAFLQRKPTSFIMQNHEKYTNQHQVKNPFKTKEDPFGLAKKRILSKQDMQFCDLVYEKARRLNVLDDDHKIDRSKCKQTLEQLRDVQEYEVLQDLINQVSQSRKDEGLSDEDPEMQRLRHFLDTDEVFSFAQTRFESQLPKVKEVIGRHPGKFQENIFNIHTLIEKEKEADMKDLRELLSATHIEVLERHKIVKDLIRLCKQYNININLPGNKNFDPCKPDATLFVENFFPTKFAQKCAIPNAFFTFKENEREALELNADAKNAVNEKRELQRQVCKLMAIVYNGRGIESVKFEDLQICVQYRVITKKQYEEEKARRKQVYLQAREAAKKASKLMAPSPKPFLPSKTQNFNLKMPPVLVNRQATSFSKLKKDVNFPNSNLDLDTYRQDSHQRDSTLELTDLESSTFQTHSKYKYTQKATAIHSKNMASVFNNNSELATDSQHTTVRNNLTKQSIRTKLMSPIAANNQQRLSTSNGPKHNHISLPEFSKTQFPRTRNSNFHCKSISTDFRNIISEPSVRPTTFMEVEPKYRIAATPRMGDSDIRALIKRYPISKQLDQQFLVGEHKKVVRRDHRKLHKVLVQTKTLIEETHRDLKELATETLITQIQQEDNERTIKLVEEMKDVSQSIMKPLFLYRLGDELNQITAANEATKEYMTSRFEVSGKYKIRSVRKGSKKIKQPNQA